MNKIVKDILEKLESLNYEAYIIGGYVRDYLLGNESNDYDICTNALVKEIIKFYPGKVSLESSLNLKYNELNIDITTYRKEHEYVKRKPNITYTDDLEEDLKRRDFTINTICMDKNGKIIDKLKGQEDLKNHLIRSVGKADFKFKEDPLRILRAIRLATVLDFNIEEDTTKAIMQNGYLLENLSGFRIKEELTKIIISPNYQKGLKLLQEFGLNKYLGLSYTSIVYTQDVCGMWAQFKISKDLPFTKTEKNTILKVQDILKEKVINNETIYNKGLYISLVAADILGISKEQVREMYNNLPIMKTSDLAISFKEIEDLVDNNPLVAKNVLNEVIRLVLNRQLVNEKEVIKEYIKDNKMRFWHE